MTTKIRRIAKGLIGLLVFLGTISAPPIDAKSNKKSLRYRVKEASGQVLAWPLSGARWHPLRSGQSLPEGSLVQVGQGGRLTFSGESGDFSAIKAETVQITIKDPMVFRLERNLFRKVKMENFFLTSEGLGDQAKKNPNVTDHDTSFFDLSAAWNRAAAVIIRGKQSGTGLVKSTSGAVEMAIRSREIKVYTPSDGATVASDRFPRRFQMAWLAVDEIDTVYEIYLWNDGTARGEPIAKTKLTSHTLWIPAPGEYLFQVTTSDSHAQSKVGHFTLSPPSDLSGQTGQDISLSEAGKDQRKSGALLATLHFPVDHFEVLTSKLPVSVAFEWGEAKTPPPGQAHHYHLVVTDDSKKVILERWTGMTSYQTSIKDTGVYHWYVEANTDKGEASLERQRLIVPEGAGRTFAIKRYETSSSANGVSALSQTLLDALDKTREGIIYVND